MVYRMFFEISSTYLDDGQVKVGLKLYLYCFFTMWLFKYAHHLDFHDHFSSTAIEVRHISLRPSVHPSVRPTDDPRPVRSSSSHWTAIHRTNTNQYSKIHYDRFYPRRRKYVLKQMWAGYWCQKTIMLRIIETNIFWNICCGSLNIEDTNDLRRPKSLNS